MSFNYKYNYMIFYDEDNVIQILYITLLLIM